MGDSNVTGDPFFQGNPESEPVTEEENFCCVPPALCDAGFKIGEGIEATANYGASSKASRPCSEGETVKRECESKQWSGTCPAAKCAGWKCTEADRNTCCVTAKKCEDDFQQGPSGADKWGCLGARVLQRGKLCAGPWCSPDECCVRTAGAEKGGKLSFLLAALAL